MKIITDMEEKKLLLEDIYSWFDNYKDPELLLLHVIKVLLI